MKLKSKKSIITSSEEGKPPKQILPHFGKYIYYAILTYVFLYVLYFIIHSILYAKGEGQIYTEIFSIFPGNTGYVEKILKKTNQTVKKGSPLVIVKYKRKNSEQINIEILKFKKEIDLQLNKLAQLQNENSDLSKKVLNINNDIYVNFISPYTIKKLTTKKDITSIKNKISQIKDQIKIEEQKEKSLKKLRILESAKRNEINNDQLIKLKSELSFLTNELSSTKKNYQDILKHEKELIKQEFIENNIQINAVKKIIEGLEETILQLQNINFENYSTEIIKSPITGTIQNIFRNKGENIDQENSIMEIMEDNPETEIRASLKEKYLNFIYPGKIVQIILPDKKKSKGKISAIYSISSRKSKILMDDYKPVKADIGIKILPFSTKDKNLWIKYNKMDIKVEFLK